MTFRIRETNCPTAYNIRWRGFLSVVLHVRIVRTFLPNRSQMLLFKDDSVGTTLLRSLHCDRHIDRAYRMPSAHHLTVGSPVFIALCQARVTVPYPQGGECYKKFICCNATGLVGADASIVSAANLTVHTKHLVARWITT